MKLTNKLNLPEALVEAVRNDPYDHDPSVYLTASQFPTPPRIVELTKRHWDDLEEDVADRIWALEGQTVHAILERASQSAQTENRLYAEIGGVKISGQFDRYENGILDDYKRTSVYNVMNQPNEDWEFQLNVLGYLAKRNGMEVSRLRVVAMMRDWQKSKAKFTAGYPPHQVAIIEFPIWDNAEPRIIERIRQQQAAETELPECTDTQRWYTGTKWAVVKETNKPSGASGYRRAVNGGLHDTGAAAIEMVKRLGPPHVVEHRVGQYRRCEEYCPVSEFCEQWKGKQFHSITWLNL